MSMIRSRSGVWCGVVLALAVVVVPLPAQEPEPPIERIRTRLSAQVAEQIEARVAEARARGLPEEALLDKAMEGLAKGVPGPRIAEAVDQLAGQLQRARSLLGDIPTEPMDLTAVADAMGRGIPEPAIQQLARGAGPDEPVALAVHTLGDLMDRGVPAEQAVAVLEAWRGRGARADELRELPGAVDRLIHQGVMPGQAAAAVANAMRAGPGGAGHGGGQGPGSVMEGGVPIPPGAGPPSEKGKPGGPPGGGDGLPDPL